MSKLYLYVMHTPECRDYDFVKEQCDEAISKMGAGKDIVIVNNNLSVLGEHYAFLNRYAIRCFYPKWKKYGKEAVVQRDKDLHEFLQNQESKLILFFWNGFSTDIKIHCGLAKKYKNPYILFNYNTKSVWDTYAGR